MKSIQDILGKTLPKDLVESLQESFDTKLAEGIAEARGEIQAEVESDFARRFNRDRDTIIESVEQMVTDHLTAQEESRIAEIEKFTEARVAYTTAMVEGKKMLAQRMRSSLTKAAEIMESKLSDEIMKLRDERKALVSRAEQMSESLRETKDKIAEQHEAHVARIDSFVTRKLRDELVEFAEDKNALVEQRVKLVTESRKKLKDIQARFVAEAAKKVENFVESNLQSHFKELHEDIEQARQNEFGRKIFNAVAAEYMTSYFAEGTEVRKLQKMLESKNEEIALAEAKADEAAQQLQESATAKEATERRVRLAEDRAERTKVMGELLANLKGEKRTVMENLLGTTKTAELRKAFNKLMPVVLSEKKIERAKPAVLSEGERKTTANTRRPVSGDKVRNTLSESNNEQKNQENEEIAVLRHLSGIKS